MWPFSSSRETPLLGGFAIDEKTSSKLIPRTSLRSRLIVSLILTGGLTLFFITDVSFLLDKGPRGSEDYPSLLASPPPSPPPPRLQQRPPPPPPSLRPLSVQEQTISRNYNTLSCSRLDSPFEFESPPDFTKIGLESWTDCKEIKAKEGWEVYHCTAPNSTWMDSTTTEGRGEGVSNTQPVGETIAQFLSRPKPRPAGQEYEYLTPPTINPAHPQPPPPPPPRVRYPPSLPLRHSLGRQEQGGPNHCNPGGYFRVKRLSTPSTDYTLGSDHSKPEQRCRTNPAHPLAVNETTKAYIDDFAGPDTFRIVLDGPEHYVTNQQVSLGDCTYAIPYVLSRPGQFWLTQIEHGYEDFEALNENYDGQFAPKFLGINILLPEVNATAPRDDAGYDAYKEYKQAVSEVYQFTVCGGCPQLLNPGSQPKYEDWPECSLEPIKGTREYGVFARRQSVLAFEDLAKQGFEWVGARPSCRHGPRLSTFQTLESVESLIGADTVSARLYGSPPPLVPSTIEAFQVSRQETENCLQHERKIYFTGDSHVRQLLTGLMNRFHGDTGDLADFQGWSTHIEQLGGVHIQQDFDQWGQDLQGKLRYMRDPSYVPFMTQPRHPLAILEEFDTILIEFGAWHAAGFKVGTMFKTVEFLEFTKEILWNLAHVRQERQAYFKRTGFGYDDLKIFWMGGIPWPDTREESDMRTNTRLQYWDDLVNAEIGAINEHYRDQGGMIDTLDAFSKFLPHRKLSPDTSHHRAKEPVDAIVQVLAHKLDLCKAHLTPVLPPPLVSLFPPAAEVISSIPASHGQASSNDLQ